MDNLARIITFTVCVVLVIPFVTIFSQYNKLHQPLLLLGPAIVVISLVFVALYRPKAYELGPDGLGVVRPAGIVRFPLQSVRSMRLVTAKDLGFGIRTFGVGGFLGYFGRYRYQNIGAATLYVTDRSKMILITFADDRKIIISPDDTAGFVAAFNELKKS